MTCKNSSLCVAKHERWKINQKRFIEDGQDEHDQFLQYVEIDNYQIDRSFHSQVRDYERVITEKDMSEVTRWGWVIERNINNDTQLPRLVLMGYTTKQRPIHLVYEIVEVNRWKLITCYTPLNKKYKWSSDFTARICFCKD